MADSLKRILTGLVASNKADKTVIVEVRRRVLHGQYKKYIQKKSRYAAHDEDNSCNVGDKIEIIESKPVSKTKRWMVKRIIEKAVEV